MLHLLWKTLIIYYLHYRQFSALTKLKHLHSQADLLITLGKNLIIFIPTVNIEEFIIFREAKAAVDVLLKKGCNSVILTLGQEGAIYASRVSPKPVQIYAPKVNAIDTTVSPFIFTCIYFNKIYVLGCG